MNSKKMSDTWCPLPWVHQFIIPDGIKTCCQGLQIESTSPSKFFKSELIDSVRQSIIDNKLHSNCRYCANLEDKGFISTRQESVEFYKELNSTNIKSQLEYLDLRYSNLCNFACRTCEPAFSSKIINEIDQHTELKKFYPLVNKTNSYSAIAQDLKDILPTVKRINFTGGEPLLIKDNIKILSELLNLGRIDCEIMITTNASVINPQWLSLLSKFQTVHWTISIDGVGPYAEYIRYGSVWTQIENNIKHILSTGHSVAFNTVLSSYSILDIDNLVSFFVDSKKIACGPLELMFHLCTQPKYLSPSVLDTQLSHNARIKIQNAVQLLSKVTDNPSMAINTLENTLKILNTSNELLRAKFIEFTATVDRIRNQNFYKLTQGG